MTDLTGEVLEIGQVESFKQGSFKKRYIVIDVDYKKFNQTVCLKATQQAIAMTDDLEVGDLINTVSYPKSHSYNGKWYTELHLSALTKKSKSDQPPKDETGEDTPF